VVLSDWSEDRVHALVDTFLKVRQEVDQGLRYRGGGGGGDGGNHEGERPVVVGIHDY